MPLSANIVTLPRTIVQNAALSTIATVKSIYWKLRVSTEVTERYVVRHNKIDTTSRADDQCPVEIMQDCWGLHSARGLILFSN